MNRNWIHGIVAGAMALTASLSAWGQPPASGRGPGGRGFGPGGPGGHVPMLRQLDLTDAQRTQVEDIMKEQRESAPGRQMRELQQQLHQAIFADTSDTAKIEELKTQIAAAEAAALNARIDTQLKIAQILTAEQRAKLRAAPARGRR